MTTTAAGSGGGRRRRAGRQAGRTRRCRGRGSDWFRRTRFTSKEFQGHADVLDGVGDVGGGEDFLDDLMNQEQREARVSGLEVPIAEDGQIEIDLGADRAEGGVEG